MGHGGEGNEEVDDFGIEMRGLWLYSTNNGSMAKVALVVAMVEGMIQ